MNGNYKGDDTIGRLMHDFGCKEAKDMYYPELAKGGGILRKKEVRRECVKRLKNMRKM